jgi:hypothetical protein
MDVVDFGCVRLGGPVAYRVQIDNVSGARVGPLSVALTPSTNMLLILSDGCGDLTLEAHEACLVSIFFMATTPVEVEATLDVSAGPSTPPLSLPVRAHSRDSC